MIQKIKSKFSIYKLHFAYDLVNCLIYQVKASSDSQN